MIAKSQTFREMAVLHRVHHLIPGSLPLRDFANLHYLGLQSSYPLWVVAFASRIRMAQKTIADDFLVIRRLYCDGVREHGVFAQLHNWCHHADSWDTEPFIVALEKACSLTDTRITTSQRNLLIPEIVKLDTTDTSLPNAHLRMHL